MIRRRANPILCVGVSLRDHRVQHIRLGQDPCELPVFQDRQLRESVLPEQSNDVFDEIGDRWGSVVNEIAEVTMRADNDIAVDGETAQQVVKLLRWLEDMDDVQSVYSNAQLGDEAYGMEIRTLIEERTGRDVAIGAVYTTLERLARKGYVTSRVGEPTAERGGRAKKFYEVGAAGLEALRTAQEFMVRMRGGLDAAVLLGGEGQDR